MRTKAVVLTAVALLVAQIAAEAEAHDSARAYRWHGAHRNWHRFAQIAPPVVTVVTPDLDAPVARYVYNRLDDGYDYPVGYGEYAIYGRWAFDRYGRPDVVRCRLVWFDGPRLRSLNRCE